MTQHQRRPPFFRTAARWSRFYLLNTPLMLRLRLLDSRSLAKGKVSVITATFNRPDKLAEAVESVRAQTYPDWEHVIVSDGPDPRVDELISVLGDPRITSFSTTPCHTSGAYQRNFALRHADGEFVLFLDDDNVIDPHCLATMVGGFDGDDVGFVVCAVRYGADRVMMPAPDFKVQQIDTLNFMIRRELVVRAGGWGPRYSADYRLVAAVRRLSRGRYLHTVVGHHR